MNKITITALGAVILVTTGLSASALTQTKTNVGRSVQSYNVTLPRQGAMTTGYAIKSNSSRAINNNTAIGGNKKLNTSIVKSSNGVDITNSATLNPGSRLVLNYKGGGSAYKGVGTKLSMAAKLGNTVRIQAQGSWSPDEN